MKNQTNQQSESLATSLLVLLALTCGQALAQDGATTPAPIPYSTMQVISEGDSDAVIAEKAAKVLPRQDGLLNGVVERYRFETSADGVTWTTNIADSSFANIQNNPSLQEVSFAPVEARYFRFTSLRAIWNSGWTSAAEISVLLAGGTGASSEAF